MELCLMRAAPRRGVVQLWGQGITLKYDWSFRQYVGVQCQPIYKCDEFGYVVDAYYRISLLKPLMVLPIHVFRPIE